MNREWKAAHAKKGRESDLDDTAWFLDNGSKVIFKPTDGKKHKGLDDTEDSDNWHSVYGNIKDHINRIVPLHDNGTVDSKILDKYYDSELEENDLKV